MPTGRMGRKYIKVNKSTVLPMNSQSGKKTLLKVDAKLHRILKEAAASARPKHTLEALTDEVIRVGLKVKKMLPVDHAAA